MLRESEREMRMARDTHIHTEREKRVDADNREGRYRVPDEETDR